MHGFWKTTLHIVMMVGNDRGTPVWSFKLLILESGNFWKQDRDASLISTERLNLTY